MKTLSFVFCACLLLFAGADLGTAQESKDKKPDPREKVETAIPKAIALLEEKKYAEMLRKFMPPEELKRIPKAKNLEEFAERFGKQQAPHLLKALKQLKDIKPIFSDDKKEVEYKLKEAISGKDSLKFVKIDKYWYIQN